MDEEIKQDVERKRREGFFVISPVFPEIRDFDFLLTNKFKT